MSNSLIALMFGAGLAAIVYYNMARRSGDNQQALWIVTLVSGILGYFVIYTLLAWVLQF